MWFQNRVPRPDINISLYYSCTLLYVYTRVCSFICIHTCHVFLLLLCVLLSCCCCSAVLLLDAAVCHRVPDDAICSYGLVHLIPVFSFSSFKHDLFLMYPLAVLSHVQPRFKHVIISYMLGNHEHARSQGGRQYMYRYVHTCLSNREVRFRPGLEP